MQKYTPFISKTKIAVFSAVNIQWFGAIDCHGLTRVEYVEICCQFLVTQESVLKFSMRAATQYSYSCRVVNLPLSENWLHECWLREHDNHIAACCCIALSIKHRALQECDYRSACLCYVYASYDDVVASYSWRLRHRIKTINGRPLQQHSPDAVSSQPVSSYTQACVVVIKNAPKITWLWQ